MSDDLRDAARKVIELHDQIAPVERQLRRTDRLMVAAFVMTVGFLAFSTGSLLAALAVVTGTTVGVLNGVLITKMRTRRGHFDELAELREAAALELHVYEDEDA